MSTGGCARWSGTVAADFSQAHGEVVLTVGAAPARRPLAAQRGAPGGTGLKTVNDPLQKLVGRPSSQSPRLT